ncbi:MAG TPA: acetyl-CoA C-acyltransferase, partial [Flavobacterium sp.]|nr:acetyl-CoA C-acyltransferase [Flavobacterium sp.]
MGNALSANLGQSPARQASIGAGISENADCTTINKVCASGMKAVTLAAQQIQLGLEHVAVAGGMESMSNAPHYTSLRRGLKLGHLEYIDGLLKDGLTDAYNGLHMGMAAERCASKFALSREMQDAYALGSYQKAAAATANCKFNSEIIPIANNINSGDSMISTDEDIFKIIPDKMARLKPVFDPKGTITAANASNLNDGAAAVVLASAAAVSDYNLMPVARIVAYADAAQAPEWFTTAPSLAIDKVLKLAALKTEDIDFFEINEAYAAVVLANQQILNLDSAKINLYGGAVAIGHPLGASGARIICTLLSVLKQENGRYGLAVICNGGGGASAIIIENINA